MEMSNEVNELFEAMSKALGEVEDQSKNAKGHGYFYTKLPDILQHVRPIYSKHGLSFSQMIEDFSFSDKELVENFWDKEKKCFVDRKTLMIGVLKITTIVCHKSGQWMKSTMELPVEKFKGMNVPQSAGSIITYGRRYALSAAIGLSDEDADASDKKEREREEREIIDGRISEGLDRAVSFISAEDAEGLVKLERELGEHLYMNVWRQLNTKQKQSARELTQKFHASVGEYVNLFKEHISNQDIQAINELKEETSNFEKNYIFSRLSKDEQEYLKQINKEAAA